jgi:hypothetical protein
VTCNPEQLLCRIILLVPEPEKPLTIMASPLIGGCVYQLIVAMREGGGLASRGSRVADLGRLGRTASIAITPSYTYRRRFSRERRH